MRVLVLAVRCRVELFLDQGGAAGPASVPGSASEGPPGARRAALRRARRSRWLQRTLAKCGVSRLPRSRLSSSRLPRAGQWRPCGPSSAIGRVDVQARPDLHWILTRTSGRPRGTCLHRFPALRTCGMYVQRDTRRTHPGRRMTGSCLLPPYGSPIRYNQYRSYTPYR